MKLVLFRTRGSPVTAPLHVGALLADGVHVADVSSAYADDGHGVLTSMRVFLEQGDKGRAVATKALTSPAYYRKLEHVDLRAPIYDPCVRLAGLPTVGEIVASIRLLTPPPLPTPPLFFAVRR